MLQKHEAHNDKSEIKQNKFPRLQELVLDYIAQDPERFLEIIRTNALFLPHMKNTLVNKVPFIKLLPKEMSILILTSLSVKDWYSLLLVNKQWNQVIIPAANHYLSNIIEQISAYDIDSSLKILSMEVNAYAAQGRRADQIQAINYLEEELKSKTTPLTKLLYYEKKVKDIQKNIEDQYLGRWSSFFPFCSPQNSELYKIVTKHLNDNKLNVSEQPWFKKAIFCSKLAATHANAQLFLDALIEIEQSPPTKNDKPEQIAPCPLHFY